jgi:hypothetical protein
MTKNLWYVIDESGPTTLYLGWEGFTANPMKAQPFDGGKYALAAISKLPADVAANVGLWWNA